MKVFVLNYLCDHTDDMSTACTIGVFKTKEEAEKAREEEYQEVLVNVLEMNDVEEEAELEEFEGINICKYEDGEWSIYDNGDYDEWRITEWDL